MSLKQYGVIITILASLIAAGFFADWAFRSTMSEKTAVAYADPNEYIKNLNASLKEQASTIPPGLTDELANSRIYLMLANKGSAYPRAHVYEDNAVSLLPQEDFQDGYYSFSQDGTTRAFFAVPAERRNLDGGWSEQATLYTYAGEVLFPSLEASTKVDETTILNKQFPTVSNAGEVLFTGWEENDWGIYYAGENGAKFITYGFMPTWINNKEFVFLKSDGIYRATLDSVPERIVEGTDSLEFMNDRIDISNDGNTLVWLRVDDEEVDVFTIGDTMIKRGTISVPGFWVTISPSGSYLAIATAAWEKRATGNPTPRIQFVDLATFDRVPNFTFVLDAFEQSHLFITDWVATTL